MSLAPYYHQQESLLTSWQKLHCLFRKGHHSNHWNLSIFDQLFRKKKDTQPKAASTKRLGLNTLKSRLHLHSNLDNTRLSITNSFLIIKKWNQYTPIYLPPIQLVRKKYLMEGLRNTKRNCSAIMLIFSEKKFQ